MTYPKIVSVSWTLPNDGRKYPGTELEKTARDKVAQQLLEGEQITGVDQPAGNQYIPAEVEGRMVDPVAQRVYIWSCNVTVDEIKSEDESE